MKKYSIVKKLFVVVLLLSASVGFCELNADKPHLIFAGDLYELYRVYDTRNIFVLNGVSAGVSSKKIEISYHLNEKPEMRESRIKNTCGKDNFAAKNAAISGVKKTSDGQLVYWKKYGNSAKYEKSSFRILRCTPTATISFEYSMMPEKFGDNDETFAQWVGDMQIWVVPEMHHS